MIGIVTALEGEPLPSGDIASRLGGFADVAAMEAGRRDGRDAEVIEVLLGIKNDAAQQLPGLPGASSTTAARSACSTTRCSTARTCSTRSSCGSRWCRCSW